MFWETEEKLTEIALEQWNFRKNAYFAEGNPKIFHSQKLLYNSKCLSACLSVHQSYGKTHQPLCLSLSFSISLHLRKQNVWVFEPIDKIELILLIPINLFLNYLLEAFHWDKLKLSILLFMKVNAFWWLITNPELPN